MNITKIAGRFHGFYENGKDCKRFQELQKIAAIAKDCNPSLYNTTQRNSINTFCILKFSSSQIKNKFSA